MRRRVINILYVVILTITLILFAITMNCSFEQSIANDDPLGAHLTVPFGIMFLIPILIAEFDMYYVAKYFLLDICPRTTGKTWLNAVACLLSCGIVLLIPCCVFCGFIRGVHMDYTLMAVLWGCVILAYLVVRIIYVIHNHLTCRKV